MEGLEGEHPDVLKTIRYNEFKLFMSLEAHIFFLG